MSIALTQVIKRKTVVVTGFGVFLILVLAFLLFFAWNFHRVVVKGESMEPTFHSGEWLMVSKAYWLVGDVAKNDIVVVKNHETGDTIIKRIYAVAGDTVDFYNVPDTWSLAHGEYKVPENQVYILGDNRPVSEDSRTFGPVDRTDILGKVIKVAPGPAEAQ